MSLEFVLPMSLEFFVTYVFEWFIVISEGARPAKGILILTRDGNAPGARSVRADRSCLWDACASPCCYAVKLQERFGPPVGPLVWDGQLAEPVSVCVSPCPKIRAP
jgi:hypothetical protein